MASTLHKSKSPSKIVGIQFSMLSPEEIIRNSVVNITSRNTYINNHPVINGLFDPRMGVLEPGAINPTDGMTYIDTPGYFGHIVLARPVFFIQHRDEIEKICNCICFKCCKLLINKNQHRHIENKSGEYRWNYVTKLATKVKRCGDETEDGCNCKQPDKIKSEGMATIIASWSIKNDAGENTTVEIKLTPELILKMFKRMSDDDVYFMGMNPKWSRPEWMICEVLPIAPPSMRPSVKHDAQQRSEDDLTHIYSNIIKTNNTLMEKMASPDTPANVIESYTTILQYSVAMIADNKIKGVVPMAQRSGRPYQCIKGRLNGKTGRIRGNLMGKRVDFSARSVITGDPNLSITQLGVPMKIAMNITKPVKVNDMNIKFLKQLVINGPDVYPGAKILERKNGDNISLRHVDRNSVRLENGDIVHRHMMDDDCVLFNRQPSLHRVSMMGHIVRVMKIGDTFRMNVAATKCYNADFDGDEMNMHVCQNICAESELRHLAAIPYQQISPTNNAPIIGIFQDSLLGAFRLTRSNVSFTARDAMNLLMMFRNVDVDELRKSMKKETGGKISSFDIISQIMPPLTLKYKTKFFKEGEEDYETSNNVLEIRAGKYIRGQMEKSVLGSAPKGILQRICNDFGNNENANFIDDLQNIVTEYMKTSSYSVGISDLISSKKTQSEISEVLLRQKMEAQKIIDKIYLGIFENNTANSNMQEFEKVINNELNSATEEMGKIARKSLNKDNRFLMIVESGSKGSALNISQMVACLGQQNVDGKRIPYGFDNRTLPHFNKFDDSPTSRGFIENSYISGLTAPELFFHAMGGRVGLIDTACRTSQTGYIQRRLVKGLEDLKVEYDMTVRNSKGKIIQFSYGDDGYDSMKTENQVIPIVSMSAQDIYLHYDIAGINDDDINERNVIYTKDAISRMTTIKERNQTRDMCKKRIDIMFLDRDDIISNVFKFKDDNMVCIPVAFQYIISNIQGQLHLTENSSVDITPLEAFILIDEYFEKLCKISPFVVPNRMFKVLYYYYLSPRDLLVVKRFHRKGLVFLLETIILKFKNAIVHPGESVGVVAGQSIGEQMTQLTLNTFHSSVGSSKSNVTTGVPRVEEILRITKNPKNPSMTVFLRPQDEEDQQKAMNYAKMLEHTRLVDVISSMKICFDPVESLSVIREDREMMEQFYDFEKMMDECGAVAAIGDRPPTSKWIIRIELNAEKLLDKNITMDDIHFAISNSQHGPDINCVYSDYNTDTLVFRIRVKGGMFKVKTRESLDNMDEIYLLKNFQDNILNNIVLRGVNRLENVLPRKYDRLVSKEEDKFVRKSRWILDTKGSNLIDLMAVDFIDFNRTFTNDIKEMFSMFGIEAARQIIFNEFVDVLENSGGIYVNYHHLSLLCDRMTSNRDLVAIYRTNLFKDDVGPIQKASFEVSTEVLLSASRHGEVDHMRGVSASVMTGQLGYYGTGAFGIVLDMQEMKFDGEDVNVKNVNEDIAKALVIDKTGQDICSTTNLTVHNNINNIIKNTNTTQYVCDDGYDMEF